MSTFNKNQNINNKNSSEIKIFSSSLSSKEVTNYNINKKNNITNAFKISEKECYDINSIVRNSVEKINDLLNSKEFNNNKKIKRQKNEILEKEDEKSKTMKTNFTFNINNFINIPNKNESLNMINKKEEGDDEDDFWIINEQNSLEKDKKKIKLNNQKRNKNLKNNKIKNKNNNVYQNRYNNEKEYKTTVRKKKLFEEGINMNYNNNINIVNYTNTYQKNKKIKRNEKEEKEEKDKSITVNIKYKKYNSGDDYLNMNENNNYILNKNNQNILNNSIKKKENNKDNKLKNSISDDISNDTQKKKKFTPNILNINSLSDHKNIKNFIFNYKFNNTTKENNKKNKQYKNYYKSPQNYKNNKINDFSECKALLFVDDKNDNKFNNKNNLSSKSYSNRYNDNDKINYIKNHFDKDIFNNLNIISRSTANKILRKENTLKNTKKCEYSCEHRNTNYFSNNSVHNFHKIYYKEFPNKIKTNLIMKLMLFLNEYLISNNLLDDYYDINNRKKLDLFSKFISSQFEVDYPIQEDVNIDKMVNSVEKIQRIWRERKIKKYLEHNNKESELKKMIINRYIKKAGFKIKKIIGLFNTIVEYFDIIGNDKDIDEMFYNIQKVIKRKLTSSEKNLLYKEYINSIIFAT